MKILRISHIGVAPKDPQISLDFFGNILGLAHEGTETVSEQKVTVDFLRTEKSRIEILTATGDDSPIAKFIETRGAGIQHIALEVDDINAWLVHLKSKGIKLIDGEPRYGAHNTKIIFIHPKSTGGVLVELVQEQASQ